MRDVALGRGAFRPSRSELSERIRDVKTGSPRTLFVDFLGDCLDETPWLLQVFGCKMQKQDEEEAWRSQLQAEIDAQLDEQLDAMQELWEEWEEELGLDLAEGADEAEETLRQPPSQPRPVVERVRMQGDHSSPFDPLGESEEAEGRLSYIASTVGRFVREEEGCPRLQGIVVSGGFALKAQLLRLVAATNRGFAEAPEVREAIEHCVEELEKLSPLPEVPGPGQGPSVPEALFGRWRLVWCGAPEVLPLASLPFTECGEICQEVAPAGGADSDLEVLDVLTTVELSPRGASLLTLLPGLPAGPLRATLRVAATPRWGSAASVRVVGGWLAASGAAAVREPLPEHFWRWAPALGFATTFLDQEVRVARTPLGGTLVWLRA